MNSQRILLTGAMMSLLFLLAAPFWLSHPTAEQHMSHDMSHMSHTSSSGSDSFTVRSVASGSWSNPATWGGRLPAEGDKVMISKGTSVTYDLQSSPLLAEITVKGNLDFTRTKPTSITFGNMTVDRMGYVEIGTKDNPIPSDIRIVIQLAATKEGGAGIDVMGHLEIHGAPLKHTFTKLDKTAENGTTTVTVVDAASWKAGDQIVITSTSLDPNETEENIIASVSSNWITLMQPLKYFHDGIAPAQGEVADLTRNVVLTSLNPDIHAMGVMFMHGAKGGISYAEFSHLGGEGILGKYPIHFHHVQNSMPGTIVDGVSVWDSHNRFIVIHNADDITVKNSVGYKGIGHGFFLEDGTEENNTLADNIAILTLPGTIRPDDGGAAGFWVQNPKNHVTGNIAVSTSGSGFDFSIPENAPEVIPLDERNLNASLSQKTTPSVLSISAFAKNEAHSNAGDGFHLYRLDEGNATDVNVFANLKMWRNDAIGIDVTASPSIITGSILFGNQQGNMQVDTSNMIISDVKVIGELSGISATLYTANGNTDRYMVSPFGLVFTASNLTIQDSTFSGHAAGGTVASADLINRSPDQLMMQILNTQLMSRHTIVFGYPFNGDSYIKVVNMNHNPALSFTLYRYDTSHETHCRLYTSYMAMKCLLTNP